MNECEDCDRIDCRERGCIAPTTHKDDIMNKAVESSGMALWSAYCDKKMELEDAQERIEKLEAALQEIVAKSSDAHPMSHESDYFRIAKSALSAES